MTVADRMTIILAIFGGMGFLCLCFFGGIAMVQWAFHRRLHDRTTAYRRIAEELFQHAQEQVQLYGQSRF